MVRWPLLKCMGVSGVVYIVGFSQVENSRVPESGIDMDRSHGFALGPWG